MVETTVHHDEVADLIRDRTERGRLYFEEFGDQFVHLGRGIVRGPSRRDDGVTYTVDYGRETCDCPDFEYRTGPLGIGCAHIFGVAYGAAKRRTRRTRLACDGCGGMFPRRDLVELHEGSHDGMAYFDGERLCSRCADNAGVAR